MKDNHCKKCGYPTPDHHQNCVIGGEYVGEAPVTASPAVAAATPLRGIIGEEVWEVIQPAKQEPRILVTREDGLSSVWIHSDLEEWDKFKTSLDWCDSVIMRVSKLPSLERENLALKDKLGELISFASAMHRETGCESTNCPSLALLEECRSLINPTTETIK